MGAQTVLSKALCVTCTPQSRRKAAGRHRRHLSVLNSNSKVPDGDSVSLRWASSCGPSGLQGPSHKPVAHCGTAQTAPREQVSFLHLDSRQIHSHTLTGPENRTV